MKHLENNAYDSAYDLEALKESLELERVPEAVERRLRQVYAELPDELPRRKAGPAKLLKGLAATAAGLAAAFVVLLGVSAVNPAFAEELPFIGGIFRSIQNRGYHTENESAAADYVQLRAQQVEGVSVEVPANGQGEVPLGITLKEIYYDGRYVYAGLEMQADLGLEDGSFYNIYEIGNAQCCGISINGEEQLGWNEKGGRGMDAEGFSTIGVFGKWEQAGDGRFIAQKAFRVPEKYRGLDSLDVTLLGGNIQYYDTGANYPEEIVANSSPYEVSFTVKKDEASLRKIQGGGLEMGGVKLVEAAATPVGTEIILEYPASMVNPAINAVFDDGRYVGPIGTWIPEKDLGDGNLRVVESFSGVREDEDRKVVCSLFDKNGSDEYEAVFILDFQNGTASLGTAEEVKVIPAYSYFGKDPAGDLLSGKATHRIDWADVAQGGENFTIRVATTDPEYRDLWIEVEQDGKTSAAWKTSARENAGTFVGYMPQKAEDYSQHTDELNVYISYCPDGNNIDPARPMVVRIYDHETKKLLDEESFVMEPEEE